MSASEVELHSAALEDEIRPSPSEGGGGGVSPHGQRLAMFEYCPCKYKQMISIYILVLLIAGEGSVAAQNVQTGHYVPGLERQLESRHDGAGPRFLHAEHHNVFQCAQF